MIPDNRLSKVPVVSGLLPPKNLRTPENLLIDYERGGIALQDATEGMNVQDWQVVYDKISGNVTLSGQQLGTFPQVQFNRTGVVNIGLAFDQNMNPAIVFQRVTGEVTLWWFDPTPGIQAQVFTTFAAGMRNPAISLDDKRSQTVATSDVLLAYQKGSGLYYRQQRERYLVEHKLTAETHGQVLFRVGLARNLRFNFELCPPQQGA